MQLATMRDPWSYFIAAGFDKSQEARILPMVPVENARAFIEAAKALPSK